MIHEQLKTLPMDGVLRYKFPIELFDYLKKYMGDSPDDFADKNPQHWGKHLAGNIKDEYTLNSIDADIFADMVKFYSNLAREYHDTYQLTSNLVGYWDDKICLDYRPSFSEKMYNMDESGHVNTLRMQSLWGNYQKKNEFNPPHNHSGIFSFVLFLKIPYDLKEEKDYFPTTSSPFKDKKGVNSCFCFRYTQPFSGNIVDVPIRLSKDDEGTGFFFPSYAAHSVYPFYTSDEYRITISGNLDFNKCLIGREHESLRPPIII